MVVRVREGGGGREKRRSRRMTWRW